MGEPQTYLGACPNHVFCENYIFKEGEPLKLFGRDEKYEEGTWLDIRNCSGVLDCNTFTTLPTLEIVNFKNCSFEKINPKTFSSIPKLRSISTRKSELHLNDLEESLLKDCNGLQYLDLADIEIKKDFSFSLTNLESLTLENCTSPIWCLKNLINLNYLKISKSYINNVDVDSFQDLQKLEYLNLSKNTFDNTAILRAILKLTNLKELKFYGNVITDEDSDIIDYNAFSKLPSLEVILFQTDILKQLNFEDFKTLKTVQIGIRDKNHDSIVEAVKNACLEYELVSTSDDDFRYNEGELQICC